MRETIAHVAVVVDRRSGHDRDGVAQEVVVDHRGQEPGRRHRDDEGGAEEGAERHPLQVQAPARRAACFSPQAVEAQRITRRRAARA